MKDRLRARPDGGATRSEPNLANGEDCVPFASGFPLGTTVDELWHYRKKQRPNDCGTHADSLRPMSGSFKLIKSEYTRRFINYYDNDVYRKNAQLTSRSLAPIWSEKPQGSLKIEGDSDFISEYNKEFVEFPLELHERVKLPESNDIMTINEFSTPDPLLTEYTAKYIAHLLHPRPPLLRRATSLSPLPFTPAEMSTHTEHRSQFVAPPLRPRPPLCKHLTQLHLDGERLTATEHRTQYVAHAPTPRRPPFVRAATNLRVGGGDDISLNEVMTLPSRAEYQREFVQYDTVAKRLPVLPVDHLGRVQGVEGLDGSGGRLWGDGGMEDGVGLGRVRSAVLHPEIPFLRGGGGERGEKVGKRRERLGEREEIMGERGGIIGGKGIIKREKGELMGGMGGMMGEMGGKVGERGERGGMMGEMGGKVGGSGERGRNMGEKVERMIEKMEKLEKVEKVKRKSTGVYQRGSYVFDNEISKKVDGLGRFERPMIHKMSFSHSNEVEMDHLNENNANYIAHDNGERRRSLKREPELKLEGNFECQPEYRKAYIDYLIRERIDRKQRPIDNLSQQTAKPSPTHVATSPAKQKSPTKPPRRQSIADIEGNVFGPKLILTQPSRSPSPVPPPSRRRKSKSLSRTSTARSSRSTPDLTHEHRRFVSTTRVENLANRPPTAAPSMVDLSTRNKWMRDSSIESTQSAFVVLENDICNNNNNNNLRNGGRWSTSWS